MFSGIAFEMIVTRLFFAAGLAVVQANIDLLKSNLLGLVTVGADTALHTA